MRQHAEPRGPFNWHQRTNLFFARPEHSRVVRQPHAKGWVLMAERRTPCSWPRTAAVLPTLLVSGPAEVRTDRIGCEQVLVQAQWALLGAGLLGP